MENISPEIQNYIGILEKTNQQLNLWYNPYGVMIGVLAILFTVLTIVAAVIIYRQSRDYKTKLRADRDFYKNKMGEFLDSQKKIIEQRNKTAEELSQKIDASLREYKKKLKESSKKQKEEIQGAIDKLEMEKLTLRKDIGLTVAPNFDYSSISTMGLSRVHKCSSCGFGFYIDTGVFSVAPLYTYGLGVGGRTVVCPKCKNVENI
ncbi:MAG: hypothetical protein NTV62_03040 [Candidatus Gribaldobacteria bacterium]|nr:hypothetical protein [Candidatus Gribaldobacteria bacterium]